MQLIVAGVAYVVLSMLLVMWRNSFDILDPHPTEIKRLRKKKRQQLSFVLSIILVSFSFIFLIIVSNIHLLGIWGLLAIASAAWGVVYCIIHLKEKETRLKVR